MNEEVKYVLAAAKHEIVSLRAQRDLLTAQMGVVEVFAAALGLKRNNDCLTTDVVWEIDKHLNTHGIGAQAPATPTE